MSEDESWMGGKTEFLYGDQPTREKSVFDRPIIDPRVVRLVSETMRVLDFRIASDPQTSDPSGKALPGRFIHSF